MTKKEKDEICEVFSILLGLFLVINFIPFIFGLVEGTGKDCKDPLTRIEYVIPGFPIGCWLGGIPGDKN